MESTGSQGSQRPHEPQEAKATGQITISQGDKDELKILAIRMKLKTPGEVVGVLLKYYMENHEPWPRGAVPKAAPNE